MNERTFIISGFDKLSLTVVPLTKRHCQFIPRNFIIDKDGKLVFSSFGYNEADFHNLVSKLKDLLDKK